MWISQTSLSSETQQWGDFNASQRGDHVLLQTNFLHTFHTHLIRWKIGGGGVLNEFPRLWGMWVGPSKLKSDVIALSTEMKKIHYYSSGPLRTKFFRRYQFLIIIGLLKTVAGRTLSYSKSGDESPLFSKLMKTGHPCEKALYNRHDKLLFYHLSFLGKLQHYDIWHFWSTNMPFFCIFGHWTSWMVTWLILFIYLYYWLKRSIFSKIMRWSENFCSKIKLSLEKIRLMLRQYE